jgi:hypothetical protein
MTTTSGAATAATPRLGRARLVLRPFGYLTIGLVWTAIWIVVLGLGFAILGYGVISGELTVAEFTEPATSSVGGFIGLVLLCAPLVVIVWGPGVFWMLPCATWPLAALSFVYVVRSLRPSYAGERLSHSESTRRGETLGLPTIAGTTLSLQPVRSSRLTDLLMAFYMSGWRPDGKTFVAMLPAGLAFLLAFPAVAVDVSDTTNLVCGVLAAALAVWSFVRALIVLRRRFWPPGR